MSIGGKVERKWELRFPEMGNEGQSWMVRVCGERKTGEPET